MSEIKYVNHLNETLVFGLESGVLIDEDSLRDYLWAYELNYQRITNFNRVFSQQTLILRIHQSLISASNDLKNDVFETFEKDVLADKKGAFWIGDYYFNCFIVGAKNSNPISRDDFLQKEITIVSDSPSWIRETRHNFYIQEQSEEGECSYPYGYPHGYSNNLNTHRILNENFVDSNFKLIIYGAVINPTVFISGHPYTVHTEVGENERLTISSLDKTVIKTKVNGEEINEFNKRNKTYSVFKEIATGQNTVSFDGTFDFEVVLFEERSEPKWI